MHPSSPALPLTARGRHQRTGNPHRGNLYFGKHSPNPIDTNAQTTQDGTYEIRDAQPKAYYRQVRVFSSP
ncbi:hypothetical protein V2G26_003455 [Clonostachys chloroleuca]